MAILYDESSRLFHLRTDDTSYALQIARGYLAHVYWGARVRGLRPDRLLEFRARASFSPTTIPEEPAFSLDTMPQEYPG